MHEAREARAIGASESRPAGRRRDVAAPSAAVLYFSVQGGACKNKHPLPPPTPSKEEQRREPPLPRAISALAGKRGLTLCGGGGGGMRYGQRRATAVGVVDVVVVGAGEPGTARGTCQQWTAR
ncbi:hypothetical protein HPB47_019343 [Ixodes persulcatus]|uniref:Uncharacterized protein n=1 Tax=Ixodes persulcatus TaxID=34615 RepID=A0AC60QIF7_IXOPE|nr:hypothetical protein HPB47_019343 [Ixodes persulcatus]